MKKLLLALSLTACLAGYGEAGDQWGVPVSQTGQILQSADYGGVHYATSSFSALLSTVTFSTQTVAGDYVVYGVEFSSGNCGDYAFVDVWDSTRAFTAHDGSDPRFRWYNVNGSTNVSTANQSACSGYSGPPRPVRFSRGLLFQPSVATFNTIRLYYRKE